MNPLLQATALRRLLATARSRLRFAALLRGLAPGLWLAAAALIVLLLVHSAPGWEAILLLIGGTVLASVSLTLYQSRTDNPRAAAAADYWLGGYGLITTAADIVARKPSTLSAAERHVLQQASIQAPAWTTALRQQVTFAPGPGLASALATLLVAVFLLSLQAPAVYDPDTPDRVAPDRVTPDRVAPDRVTPDRVAPDRSRLSAARPDPRAASAEKPADPAMPLASDAGTDPGDLSAIRNGTNLPTKAAITATASASTNLPAPEIAQNTQASQRSADGAGIQRRGDGAAGQDSHAAGLATSASVSGHAQVIGEPDYQPFVTGSSATIVRRFFARQEFSDE